MYPKKLDIIRDRAYMFANPPDVIEVDSPIMSTTTIVDVLIDLIRTMGSSQ